MRNVFVQNGTSVIVEDRVLIVNGKKYKLPKGCRGNNISITNGEIYIDGYEFKDGQFKRSAASIFRKFF